MKTRSGLKKIKKSTRKGLRSYWVKSDPKGSFKSMEHPSRREDQGRALGHGMGNLGAGLGALVGAHHAAKYGMRAAASRGVGAHEAAFGAALVGGHFGGQAGRQAGRLSGHVLARTLNMRESTERALGSFAHLAGTGLKMYGLYRTVVEGAGLYNKHHQSFHRAYDAYRNYTR